MFTPFRLLNSEDIASAIQVIQVRTAKFSIALSMKCTAKNFPVVNKWTII